MKICQTNRGLLNGIGQFITGVKIRPSARFYCSEQPTGGVFGSAETGGPEVSNLNETGILHQLQLVPDRNRAAYSLTPGFEAADQMTWQLSFQH